MTNKLEIKPGDSPAARRVKLTFDMFMSTVAFRQLDKYDGHTLLMHYKLFCICEAMTTFHGAESDQARATTLLDLFREIESAAESLREMERNTR